MDEVKTLACLEGFRVVLPRSCIKQPRLRKDGKIYISTAVLEKLRPDLSGKRCRVLYNLETRVAAFQLTAESGNGTFRLEDCKNQPGLSLRLQAIFRTYGLFYEPGEVDMQFDKESNTFFVDLNPVLVEGPISKRRIRNVQSEKVLQVGS